MSKETATKYVHCTECQPFQKFDPPNAAEQLKAHYDAGQHWKRP